MAEYWVYIMASQSGTLYTGVTSDLERRVWEHKTGATGGFTKRYGCNRLVYFESTGEAYQAIQREKQVKAWTRAKREALIRTLNPGWRDLANDWYGRGSALRSE
jgi:putative endonuclease